MITVTPEADYDCIYVELVDDTSRVRIHLHALPGALLTQRQLRQIEVNSKAETVFALDRTREDKLPCDPHGLGGQDVNQDGYLSSNDKSVNDEDGTKAEESA